ncbi:arsenate reductase (glutaredoxin) [Thaumasiovibrio sp. DFM-14]|uniref:arsenate reductase (glutaredoxin) n=1 Tax=Thaumasiovibrio sp. DFM-14 TaxID=3384792 RepID=UPI0039A24174
MPITIYHNPKCSKSRATLTLLQERGIEPDVVRYLDTPLDVEQLQRLLSLLGFEQPRQLMRIKDALYKELELDKTERSNLELLQAMQQHPKLIERPIVVNGDKAVLGRPPENVLDIL